MPRECALTECTNTLTQHEEIESEIARALCVRWKKKGPFHSWWRTFFSRFVACVIVAAFCRLRFEYQIIDMYNTHTRTLWNRWPQRIRYGRGFILKIRIISCIIIMRAMHATICKCGTQHHKNQESQINYWPFCGNFRIFSAVKRGQSVNFQQYQNDDEEALFLTVLQI